MKVKPKKHARNPERGVAKSFFNKQIKDYFKETTVHGFRYLVEDTTRLEKGIWTAVILAGFFYAGILIRSNIIDWAERPGK